ncbi:MAG TPA: murein biosynthesis integral membrane protein MurJ, partial [Blastocatellia bacterium]|nr:murein biosynthesis integral membrane protein MurJ [Blastocatellia bacterium]
MTQTEDDPPGDDAGAPVEQERLSEPSGPGSQVFPPVFDDADSVLPRDAAGRTAAEPSPTSVTRSAGIVGAAILVSRVLGLIREIIFAYFFGASKSFAFDAYVIAFRIPNLLRNLVAEGALSAAFVAVFSDYLAAKDEKEAMRLSSLVTTALILILIVIVIFGIILAPTVVTVLAPGYRAEPAKFALTVKLTRILMPFILVVTMAAKAMGALNAKDKFAVPALAGACFSAGSIIGGLTFAAFLTDPSFAHPVRAILADPTVAIAGMAYGALIGGFLQYVVQWPALRRAGFRYRPGLSFTHPGVRRILRLMTPAVVGAAALQVNVVVNSNFASSLPGNGPVSWLAYAFRLMQFPIGVFGIAISTATLPAVSRSAALGRMDQFRRTLATSLRLAFILTIPSAVGLIVLGGPIIALIFQRGGFTFEDTRHTAGALGFYAIGLAGYAAVRILAPAFYALDDAMTPMLASLISILVNLGLNWALAGPLGERGLALSTSVVAILNFALLYELMRRRLGGLEVRHTVRYAGKVTAAAAVMGAVCWAASHGVSSALAYGGSGSTIMGRMANVVIPVGAGAAVFYGMASFLGLRELS